MLADCLTLYLPDQIFNSLYCQPYNSYNVSSENLLLDQLIIPKLIFFFILITYLVDIVLILWGEILSWSLMGVKGFIQVDQQITCVMFMYNVWLKSLKKKHDLQWVEDLWTQSTYIYMDKNLVALFNRLFLVLFEWISFEWSFNTGWRQ